MFPTPIGFSCYVRYIAYWLLSGVIAFSLWGSEREVSLEKGNLLVTPQHGGDGTAWGKSHCKSCHQQASIHKNAPTIRPMVIAKGYTTCTGCHGQNGTYQPRRCIICHKDLPEHPLLTGRHKHDFSVKRTLPFNDWHCVACHVSSDMDGRFELNTDLTIIQDHLGDLSPYKDENDFCLRCHNRDHLPPGVHITPRPEYGINDPITAIEDNYRFIDKHGVIKGLKGPYSGLREGEYTYPDVVACTDCHALHGTRNTHLILDDSRKGAARLNEHVRMKPTLVKVEKGNYAQLCVLCHAMEHSEVEQGALDTGNGLAGVHDVVSDCTTCHTHGEPIQGGL